LDLSIIIVNWNSAEFVRKCLQSIYAGTKGCDFEVIVVDNASFDACGEICRGDFPGVKFISSAVNLGFAKANNLGAEYATGRILLILNPDTEVKGDAVSEMLLFLDSHPDAGIAGCRLLNTDGTLQTDCLQVFPTILNQALDTDQLRRAFPKLRLWRTEAFARAEDATVIEAVSGACLMIKSDVFRAVGGFTPNYFMYAEDVDLCFKVDRAGWKNYYLPAPCVVHHGGQSSDQKPESHFASVMMRQSLLEFMRLRHGRVYAAAYQSTMVVIALLRLLLLALAFIFALGGERRESLRLSFGKWVKVLRWGLNMERWTRQAA
jgi:N-acetylglucosaminyl-diphospho-decaprenol L-rhamnosyltransferase